MSRYFSLIPTILLLIVSSCTIAQQDIPTQTSSPTLTATTAPTATITPTPKLSYDLCPNIENYHDCYVPEEELLDGSYWHWLNEVVAPTLLKDFKAREDQIIDDTRSRVIGLSAGATIFYPQMIGKNEKEIAFWNREVTFGYTEITDPITNETLEYLILPVFFYDKETQQVFPVITVAPLFHPEKLERLLYVYWNEMYGPIILYSSSNGLMVQENITMDDNTDPLVNEIYKQLGQEKVFEMIKAFYEGDLSALSVPGAVFTGKIVSGLY